MPTLSQIQQTILSAQYLQAENTDANRIQLEYGYWLVDWTLINRFNRLQAALGFQVNRIDYTSRITLAIYDQLNALIGLDPTNNNIDPNFQYPGIIIDNEGAGTIPQIEIGIIGGVTMMPLTVPYTGFINPTIIYRKSDGSNYGGAVNNVDTGSAIILTGDSDGSGHFADSFTMVIKQ
jgi:hypothetical protein